MRERRSRRILILRIKVNEVNMQLTHQEAMVIQCLCYPSLITTQDHVCLNTGGLHHSFVIHHSVMAFKYNGVAQMFL